MYRLAKVLMLLGLGWASGSAQAYLIQVSQGGSILGTVQPYTGTADAAINYNYNPVGGYAVPGNGQGITAPTTQAQQARIWFYDDIDDASDGLAWNVIFNTRGAGGAGSANWDINLINSATDASVLVSDDPNQAVVGQELRESTITNNSFTGNWRWGNLTDGGVIGPLGGSNWTLTITANSYSGLLFNGLQVAGPGGSIIPLALTTGSTASIVFTPLLNGIPEPASALLLASGLAATLGWRRRRASRQPVTTAC